MTEQPEKAPPAPAVHVPERVPDAIVRLTVPAVKPVPETVSTVPTGPEVGARLREEATV